MEAVFYTENIDILYTYEHKIDLATHAYLYNARCKVSHNSVTEGSFYKEIYIEKCKGLLTYLLTRKRKYGDSPNGGKCTRIALPANIVELNKKTLILEVTNMFQRGHSRGDKCCQCCKMWSDRQKKIFDVANLTTSGCHVLPKIEFSDDDILQEIGCKTMDAKIDGNCISAILSQNGFTRG